MQTGPPRGRVRAHPTLAATPSAEEGEAAAGHTDAACALRDDAGAYTGGVDPYYYPATAIGVD